MRIPCRTVIAMKKKNSVLNIAMTAVFAALIALMTSQIKVYVGTNDGYIHFGDSMIYLASCVLPLPYAMLSAAVGGAIADLLAGAAVWAPATAIIKAINVLPFALVYTLKLTKKPNKILSGATAAMPIVSGLVTIVGYFVAEGIMYSFESAIAGLPLCWIQPLGSAAVFYILAAALDKLSFKSKIYKLR